MTLRVYNVLGREKQDFVPLHEGRVGMYVCGPTVYDHAHLGHAKTYISFDVVFRWLRHLYGADNVVYVQNITDVGHLLESGEDRILRKARQLQAKPMQIADSYARSFNDDMRALGVLPPDIQPRASGHVPEQIEMIQRLIAGGHAYEVHGSVYFDVTSDPDYGKLSNRRLADAEEGTRVAARDDKRHPADFALWKRAEPEHIMRWNSPWGEGFPGWHIECSAMARKYLGPTFDIHGGGLENMFPHNESEIAQSECANDAPFAQYWLLTGSLTVDSVKMSKSLGNFTTIRDALRDYRPEVVRMFVLTAHYSNPIDYSDEALDAARSGWERLNNAVRLVRAALRGAAASGGDGHGVLAQVEAARAAFDAAMNDDFNAPKAIAGLQEFTREVNALLNGGASLSAEVLDAIDAFYRETGGAILGLVPDADEAGADAARERGLIEMVLELRTQARAARNWAESDRLRDRLEALGVQVEDRADGTTWRVV